MKEWYCKKCGHEVLSYERPAPIRWTDGHVCYFVRRWTEEERKEKMEFAGYEEEVIE